MGNIVVTIVMFGWIPAVLAMFSGLPPRRAVIAAFLLAWLFLPTAGFKLAEGIPVYDKMSATCAGVFLGAILFDTGTLLAFRPSWIDLPMLIWCLCPIASSVSNDLGLYNGLSTAFRQSVEWGLPYLIGRLYFRKLDDLRELAIGIFIGGLLYAPLCVWEMRMSPQLSSTVYGIAAKMTNSVRFGGWRPVVFMRDGLMVGMWMCMSALVGWWLWMSRAVPQVWRSMPPLWLMGGLFATALLCRSIGAVVLMTLGMAMLLAVARLGWRWVVWVLLLSAPAYIAIRAQGLWDGQALVALADQVSRERASSLGDRLRNEDMLAAKAMEQPVFGWGTWGRNNVYDERGQRMTVTDGLWIIVLGCNGVVGLTAWLTAMLLPPGMVLILTPSRRWGDRAFGGMVGLACCAVLYVIDCIPNAMANPMFVVVAGGLAGPGLTLLALRRRAIPHGRRQLAPRREPRTVGISTVEQL